MIELMGEYVEVEANNIVYAGKLIEVGETDVYLQAESGWIVIPVDQIAAIRKKERA